MKKFRVFLGMILSFVLIFVGFGLAGCGEASISTLKENFKKLSDTYAKYDTIFTEGEVDNFSSNYKINFGATLNTYISQNSDGFGEIEDLYNVAFAISNDYVDKNKDYILIRQDKDLNSDMKKKVDDLNKSLVEYTKQISKFVDERNALVDHFERNDGFVGEESNQAALKRFKDSFGVLVEKNVKFSTDLAETVESTKIFDFLGELTLLETDTEIVKDFIRAKMLHIFTDFKISEIANKMTWSSQVDGDCKARIDTLLRNLDKQYEKYKNVFVKSSNSFKQLSKEEFSQLFDVTNEFLVESKAYDSALKGINFKSLATEYGNNLSNYKKKNKLAEVYLQKLEQFVSITLPNFMDNVSKLIFK